MKKIVLLLIIFITLASLMATQKDLRYRPSLVSTFDRVDGHATSYVYEEYSTVSSEWVDVYDCNYTYDVNTLTGFSVKKNVSDSWEDFELYTYEYNTDEFLSTTLYQVYEPTLTNYQQENYVYTIDNWVSSYKLENWVNETWQDSLVINYTYEGGVLIDEDWIYTTPSKETSLYKRSYEYNTDGYITLELWESSTDGTNWENYSQGIYTLDADNNILEEKWYSYVNAWIDYSKFIYEYNDETQLALVTGSTYYNTIWTNYSKITWDYSEYQYADVVTAQYWSTTDTDWVNSTRYTYEYEPLVPTSNDQAEIALVNISSYPNPSNSTFNIKASTPIQEFSIYNLKGQKVLTETIRTKSTTVNVSNKTIDNLPSGVYFINIKTNGNKSTYKKHIIMH